MATREHLQVWVIDALVALGGSGRIVQICRHIWDNHEADLRASGDLLYTWQYDVRWAGQKLRDTGRLKPVHGSRSRPWELA